MSIENTNENAKNYNPPHLNTGKEISMFEHIKRENADLFRSFLDNSPHLFWIIDDHIRLIHGNKSFFGFIGLDPEKTAYAGSDLTKIVPGFIVSGLRSKYEKVIRTKEPYQGEEKIFMADGTEQVFLVNIFPVKNSLNPSPLIGAQAINITNESKKIRQLNSANERLSYIGKVTNDAIWEWDMRTGNVYRNEMLYQMIGYIEVGGNGLSWWFKRIHPEDRNRVTDKINEAADKGALSWEDEYRFKCADGNYKYIYDRGFIVYENGLPVKMIGSLHDVTELKDLREKLINERIERQKETTETIFKVQEKERTRIAHELHDNVNQILTSAKLFLNMIKPADLDSSDIKRRVDEFILMAIEEIRALSKEMITPRLKDEGLVASITDLVEDLRASSPMSVFFHHEEDVESLGMNKKITIFRLIQEQVKNALTYSNASNLVIELSVVNSCVELIVKDDGVGFDLNQTRRGIGLSNIYERTRFYNGTVQITTKPGQGCRIRTVIPLDEEDLSSGDNEEDFLSTAI